MPEKLAAKRPFGQSKKYDFNLLKPTLDGPHYKFSILLPVVEFYPEQKNEFKFVFTKNDLEDLQDLLRTDFGGVTYSTDVKHPLIQGDWIDKNGDVVANKHMRFEVYTQKNVEAVEYFVELKARLLKHVKDVRHMEQEDIVIERLEVDFTPSRALGMIRRNQKEKV
jgi:hypothetical protein